MFSWLVDGKSKPERQFSVKCWYEVRHKLYDLTGPLRPGLTPVDLPHIKFLESALCWYFIDIVTTSYQLFIDIHRHCMDISPSFRRYLIDIETKFTGISSTFHLYSSIYKGNFKDIVMIFTWQFDNLTAFDQHFVDIYTTSFHDCFIPFFSSSS